MLNKEFRDTLKRLGECFFILIGVPLGYLWDRIVVRFRWDFWSIFNAVFVAFIFVYAAYSGATIFLAEKKDRAFEYLFSLPVSRTRILATKLLPRLGSLLVLYAVLTILSKRSFFSSVGLMLAFIFSVGVFLSLAIDSVVIGLLGILLLSGLYYFMLPTFSFMAWKLHLIPSLISSRMIILPLCVIILLLPFGIAFWQVYSHLDSRPLNLQMKRYYLISLPSLLVLISLIMMFYGKYVAMLQRN
jgi:ABC-type transport system involved in multi-copper enzyme maturation permease subunit